MKKEPRAILVTKNQLVKLIPKALRGELPDHIVVVFVSPKESKILNRRYRKKGHSTNVLSFLYNHDYGEILLCKDIICREAKTAKNSLEYQMTWMILHGMLHLAGMHHEVSRTVAAKTEQLERKILTKLFPK